MDCQFSHLNILPLSKPQRVAPISRSHIPRTSPKTFTLPPWTAAGSSFLRVLPCEISAKYFCTDAKILCQSLKAGHDASPFGLALQEHTCAEHLGRMFLRPVLVQTPTCNLIPRASPKLSRCRHGRRRAPFLCEFCLAKLAQSIFARTQKYFANPLNQVMMQVLRPCIARTYLCGAPG